MRLRTYLGADSNLGPTLGPTHDVRYTYGLPTLHQGCAVPGHLLLIFADFSQQSHQPPLRLAPFRNGAFSKKW